MGSKRHELARSTMFTVLLEVCNEFGGMEARAGEHMVTEALSEWYDSPLDNMFDFGKKWVQAHARLSLKKSYT